MSGIGKRLKLLRNNLSQGEFALKFGIHRNTLARWESEEREPDITFLVQLAEQECVAHKWLLTGEGPRYEESLPLSKPADSKNGRRAAHLENQHAEIIGSDEKKGRHVAHFGGISAPIQPSEAPDGDTPATVAGIKKANALKNKEMTNSISATVAGVDLHEEFAALNKELRDLLRQNGDLRVENAELRARVRDLERELREALKKDERQAPVASAG